MPKRAIIIQGAPGVGKTTLARKLERDLGLKLIAKDDIKEYLYNRLGLPRDRDESMLYGRIAIRVMYGALDEFLKAGQRVLIEAALLPDYASKDLSSFTDIEDVLQLYVYCNPEIHEKRFSNRAADGTRHPGHIEASINAVEEQKRYGAIPGIETIMVDTTNFTDEDYQTIVVKCRAYIGEG